MPMYLRNLNIQSEVETCVMIQWFCKYTNSREINFVSSQEKIELFRFSVWTILLFILA